MKIGRNFQQSHWLGGKISYQLQSFQAERADFSGEPMRLQENDVMLFYRPPFTTLTKNIVCVFAIGKVEA